MHYTDRFRPHLPTQATGDMQQDEVCVGELRPGGEGRREWS